MPGGDFELDSYSVGTSQYTGSSYRTLRLTSVTQYHGITPEATMFFGTWAPGMAFGWVLNVNVLAYVGHSIFTYLPLGEYRDIYDLVRSEKPLRFNYFYEEPPDPSTHIARLTQAQVYTGLPEPPGEGPRDVSPP